MGSLGEFWIGSLSRHLWGVCDVLQGLANPPPQAQAGVQVSLLWIPALPLNLELAAVWLQFVRSAYATSFPLRKGMFRMDLICQVVVKKKLLV